MNLLNFLKRKKISFGFGSMVKNENTENSKESEILSTDSMQMLKTKLLDGADLVKSQVPDLLAIKNSIMINSNLMKTKVPDLSPIQTLQSTQRQITRGIFYTKVFMIFIVILMCVITLSYISAPIIKIYEINKKYSSNNSNSDNE